LTPEFFSSMQYPNSFVYVDACNSSKEVPSGGNSLRDAFRNNGAGAYVGWNGPISTKFSNPVAESVFDGLSPTTAQVTGVQVTTSPDDPGPGESYVPTATVNPPEEGVEVRLSVKGDDGFRRTETGTTDASGSFVFAAIPGGAGEVTDIVTVVAGGADNGATVLNVLQDDPQVNKVHALPWGKDPDGHSVADLGYTAETTYNLVCNDIELTDTKKVVKF
jgi:hypothetical protein